MVHDEQRERVFLARDRVGVKNLYYSITPDRTLLFASEPKALLAHPEIRRNISASALTDYALSSFVLTNGFVPESSFFESISILPAGHFAYFDASGLRIRRYYEVPFVDRTATEEAALAEQLREAVTSAIEIRLPDPTLSVCTALSGGLDSSIVTGIVQRSRPDLEAFSIRFSHGENSDHENAQFYAEHANVKLVDNEITPEAQVELIDDLIHAFDGPHDTARQLGLFQIFSAMQQRGHRVVLVGEGADEFNLGYFKIYPGFTSIPQTAADFRSLWQTSATRVARLFNPTFLTTEPDAIITHNIARYYDACPSDDPIDKMQYYYIKKFLPYRLAANDCLGMARSLEVRVPFCDHNVIAASLRVPHHLNLQQNTEKFLLRKAFSDLLPPRILWRAKAPLPENRHTKMLELLAKTLASAIDRAPSAVWDVLAKSEALRFQATTARLGATLGTAGAADRDAIKNAFLSITLIRWLGKVL